MKHYLWILCFIPSALLASESPAKSPPQRDEKPDHEHHDYASQRINLQEKGWALKRHFLTVKQTLTDRDKERVEKLIENLDTHLTKWDAFSFDVQTKEEAFSKDAKKILEEIRTKLPVRAKL